jgi:hypothetical protein
MNYGKLTIALPETSLRLDRRPSLLLHANRRPVLAGGARQSSKRSATRPMQCNAR